jgi:AcrR family transcriptional regulator
MKQSTEGADQLMLGVARQIVRKEGWSALRIRDLVKQADVNLGMFHYHFQSKENFKKIVLQAFYEEFFQRFIVVSREGSDPLVQFRNSLVTLGIAARDERRLLLSLLRDVLNEDPEVMEMMESTVGRHVSVLRKLLKKCQKERKIVQIPASQALAFIMSSMNFPTLIGAAMEKRFLTLSKSWIQPYCKTVFSDEAIAQRVDFALRGLQEGLKA